jgi:glucan biosynthesis protein C
MSGGFDNSRMHALDNLRAMLMWLGIVLHVAINHLTGPMLLPFRDPQTSPVADLLVMFIHTFRMPAFFMLAGFLAAMMVASRGHGAMLRNRVRRIALPFAVFWPPVFVAMILLVLVWAHLMKLGSFGIDVNVAPKKMPGHALVNTMHMWFVYYLFIFCALAAFACAIGRRIPALAGAITRPFSAMARHWWCLPLLAVPMAIAGSAYPAGMIAPGGSFVPNLRELVHSGMFFTFGWVIYRHRDVLLARFAAHCWRYALIGWIPYLASGALFYFYMKDKTAIPHFELAIAYVYGLAGWIWSIALLGIFTRYLSTQNRVLRYLSDSSYWVFIVHMLGTVGFGALLFPLSIPAELKIIANIAATTVACLVTYEYLVRRTWIGVLLNGSRKYGAATAPRPDLARDVPATSG